MKSSSRIRSNVIVIFALAVVAGLPPLSLAQTDRLQQPAATVKSNRGYTIARETTFFTGPLKADGSIDFIAAVNQHFSKGVTDENNAAREIVPLLDPSNWGQGNPRRDRVIEAMGLDADQYPPEVAFSEASYFRPEGKESDLFLKEFNAGTAGPWVDRELPRLAKFLSENSAALDKISAATRKERFFVPLLVEGKTDSLVAILLEHIQGTRSVARGLAIRANNHLGNGRWKEAWDDILAIKRLGYLVGQGPTLIEGLVGVAINGIGCKAATLFINAADSKEVDWAALQESWETRPIARVTDQLGVTERAMFIQLACKMKDNPREEMPEVQQFNVGSPELLAAVPYKLLFNTLRDMLATGEVKLDDALRYANDVYDRAIAIGQMSDAQERHVAFMELEKRLEFQPFEPGQSPLVEVLFAKPQKPADQFSKAILGMVFPSANTINRAERRTEASQHVVELALAARVLQAQSGNLPQSLRELEPFVDEAIMTQPATGATVAFRPEGDGILIYHWCANQIDNGGEIDGDRPADWGIRIAK